MNRLLVVQPYLAEYRIPFWNKVRSNLAAADVELALAIGEPSKSHAGRGDSLMVPYGIRTPSRLARVGGPVVRWQKSWTLWSDFDAVILEASGSLIDACVAAAGSKPFGLWGHIDSFTGSGNPIDRSIEKWQLRRAASVFAYTDRGRKAAIRHGVQRDRIWVLNNTIETEPLIRARSRMTSAAAHELLGTNDSVDLQYFAFLGGLDSSKRIDFLVEALDRLWDVAPRMHLLVAGKGDQESLLDCARDRGQVTLLGRAGAVEKAALGTVASAVLMPGRVGLVAVDSFAMGLPIVTTSFPDHAPEFEYLTAERDCVVSDNSVESYVYEIVRLMQDPARLMRLRAHASSKAGWPSLGSMVNEFILGCHQLLGRS